MAFAPTCWPLCGRITDSPPAGWALGQNCPPSRCDDPSFSDLPLSTSFGPRPLGSENERYDFHRGIDISCPIGTPIFAVAAGQVLTAGTSSFYSDPVVLIRHYRPGFTTCSGGGGCYVTIYNHMRTAAAGGCCAAGVVAGATVAQGQFIGYSGASSSGYAHLHFEVRDAPADDPFSYWQRDAVHGLRLLRYPAPQPATAIDIAVSASESPGDAASAANLTVAVHTTREDVLGVSLALFDAGGSRVTQPGDTPDARGYRVHPPAFLYEELNRMYTHKDSSAVPWSSFGAGGSRECPFHAQHGSRRVRGSPTGAPTLLPHPSSRDAGCCC